MARATIRFYDEFYSGTADLTTPLLISGSKTKAVWVDPNSGDKLILQGSDFDYDDGVISHGTITKLSVIDDGKTTQSVGDFKIDARFLMPGMISDQVQEIAARAIMGNVKAVGSNLADSLQTYDDNDLLLGRGGDDTLSGAQGKDVMVDGTGSDIFVFSNGFGKDVIRDFDADGGAGLQDFIDATFPGAGAVSKSGKNTIIDFGSGDTLTLLNVLPSHIDSTDFV